MEGRPTAVGRGRDVKFRAWPRFKPAIWPVKPGNEHCRRPISITPLCLLFIFPGWTDLPSFEKVKTKNEKKEKKRREREREKGLGERGGVAAL